MARKERAFARRTEPGQSIVITSTGYGIKTVVYGSQAGIVAITVLLDGIRQKARETLNVFAGFSTVAGFHKVKKE
jgi:hypothetical protein